jgi:hypothetical protein
MVIFYVYVDDHCTVMGPDCIDITVYCGVEASWNVMAHAQKPDFVFRRNGRVNLNRRGRQCNRLLVAEVCASALIVGSNAGYTTFRGSVKGTGYPHNSPVSPSLLLPCFTMCHHISTGVYHYRAATQLKTLPRSRCSSVHHCPSLTIERRKKSSQQTR